MIDMLIKQIPLLSNCKEIVQINKGFSFDEKYLIHMPGEKKLFLRLFDPKQLGAKKLEYAVLEKMQEYHVACSKPLAIGEIGDKGYLITSYIEGEDAESEILAYSDQEQFNIGFEAGKELRKMHQYAAPQHIASWHSRKMKKHKNYIDAYMACGIKVRNDHKIMKFIDDNIHLMENRPNLFQHDDFHLGNLIVNNRKFAGVIDFDRYDWGDPIHEFLKIGIFSREKSVHFSVGQIKGYFNNAEPDEDFWKLYSLYLAMCVFSTVVWTLKTIPEDMEIMLNKVYRFLDDHDDFNRMKPKWYS